MKKRDHELDLLKIKNRRLEKRVDELERELQKSKRIAHTYEDTVKDISIERYESYLKYKYNMIKATDVWNTAERIVVYSRRSLFIARLFKVASVAVAFIETSAVFILCATVLFFFIPSALLIALIIYLVDIVVAKKQNARILPALEDKKIVFLIAQKGYSSTRGSYFDRMARELADNGHYYVIVVSKSLRDGLIGGVRFEGENLIVVRETYYFRLKKALKEAQTDTNDMITVH